MHESHERDNLCHFRGNRERNENRSLWHVASFLSASTLPSNETNFTFRGEIVIQKFESSTQEWRIVENVRR